MNFVKHHWKNFALEDVANGDEGSGSLGKRERKTTATMKESLDQANDQDTTKKKRKDNKGKENVSSDQADTTRQEG